MALDSTSAVGALVMMNFMRWVPHTLAALALGAVSAGAIAETWSPLTDRELEVQAGSPLDFSALNESGAAGRYGWAKATGEGHIAFERQPTAQRFLCASYAFSPTSGGMPTAEQGRRLAVQLRRTGYNLARLHYADAMLMSGRERDFDFDPVQLDRFFQFTAALKEQGIYWVVDALTSDNGAYGDPDRNRWKKKHDLKRELLTSPEAQAHWAKLVTELWGRRNPYTGLSTFQDPALLGVILVNEGSLAYLSTIRGNRWPDSLGPVFAAWVRTKYANDDALRTAWGKDLQSGDSVTAKSLDLPQIRATGPRASDFLRFVTETEQAAFRRMDTHVRSLGFGGLTTAYDNWGFLQADVSRSAAGWIDMHAYSSLPTAFSQPGSTIEHQSAFDKGARWVRELTQARQWGKPFTVSEWGQPFWNRWRYESVALLPAVAAHQGWDAICQFAENPVSLTYAGTLPKRLEAIHPFAVGVDPILRMGERLAALLYLRGDVTASDARLRLDVDADALLARGRGWEQVPESIGRLTLAVPSGLALGAGAKMAPSGRELVLSTARDGPGWMRMVDKVASRLGLDAGPLDDLRKGGLLPRSNITDPRRGLIESDTGQIKLDGTSSQLSIVTDRSLVVVMRGADGAAGGLAVRESSAPALFSVSSIDGQKVGESRRLLMFVLTDAINTDMTFTDGERRTIRTLGRLPPQVVPLRARFAIASSALAKATVYPLSMAGERRGPGIAAVATDGALQFEIDTAKLDGGPALAFEIVPN